jgi:hypothetical protein
MKWNKSAEGLPPIGCTFVGLCDDGSDVKLLTRFESGYFECDDEGAHFANDLIGMGIDQWCATPVGFVCWRDQEPILEWVDRMKLSTHARRVILSAPRRFPTVGHLRAASDTEILSLKNCGKDTLAKIRELLR